MHDSRRGDRMPRDRAGRQPGRRSHARPDDTDRARPRGDMTQPAALRLRLSLRPHRTSRPARGGHDATRADTRPTRQADRHTGPARARAAAGRYFNTYNGAKFVMNET